MKELPPRSVLKKVAVRLVPVSVLIFAGCSGGGAVKNSSYQELEKRESGYSLPFPQGETWFLTNGPHGDGSSNGIRNAIDIAPPEGGFCPPDGRKFTIDNRTVTASASGEVTIKGNDKNRDDPFHSIVDIKDKNGLTQRFVHLDNTRVKLGSNVNKGDPLGNPSCEYPPGGANTGPHVHIALMKDGRAIPIAGIVVGGWTIHEGVDGREGTMTKPGEKTRTANTGRYGENSTGIRNDLPNNPNKAVVASPKDRPIPPISATITSKEVFTPTPTPHPTAIPTPKPTETPKPVEKPVEVGWNRFTGNGYQIDYPSGWKTESENIELSDDQIFNNYTVFVNEESQVGIKILSGPLKNDSNLDFLEEDMLKELQNTSFLQIDFIRNQTLGGQKARAFNKHIPTSDGHRHEIYYLTVKGQRVWAAELDLGDDLDYDKNLKILNSVLSSFQFTNSTEFQSPAPITALTQKATPIPTRAPTPTRTPTPKPTETQKPAVAEREPKSLDQQAKGLALDKFLSLLFSSQSLTEDPDFSIREGPFKLTSTVENRKLVNGRLADFPYSEVLKSKQTTDNDYLLFNWMYYYDGFRDDQRVVGQGEIKNIRIYTTANFISVADKANGVEWQGNVSIKYIVRSRVLYPFITFKAPFRHYSGNTTMQDWTTSGSDEQWAEVAKKPSGPFSEWRDEGMSFSIALKDRQWRFGDHLAYPLRFYPFTGISGRSTCNRIPGCEEFRVTLK